MTYVITPAEDPYPDDIFIAAPKTHPIKGSECVFGSSPDEVKEALDQSNIKDAKAKLREKRIGNSEQNRTSLERYLPINADHRYLIKTIQSTLFGPPVEQLDNSITGIVESGQIIEEYKEYNIIRTPIAEVRSYMVGVSEAASVARAAGAIPGALLMAFVSSFDAFLSDFIKAAIRDSKDPLTYSDRKLTLREVLEANNLDQLKEEIIEEEVEQILRESHLKQGDYIRKVCQFDPFDRYARKADYLEIFERRNLAAHGIERFNESYCRNMSAFGAPQDDIRNQTVHITPEYLRRCLDILAEFACLADFAYKAKKEPENVDQLVRDLSDKSTTFISSHRLELATWILSFLSRYERDGYGEYARKLVHLNLANAHFLLGNDEKANDALNAFDWTASAEEFQIREASLKGDVAAVNTLLPRFASGDKISKNDFRTLPVFQPVREDRSFQLAFKEVFGEQLIESPIEEAIGAGVDYAAPEPSDDCPL